MQRLGGGRKRKRVAEAREEEAEEGGETGLEQESQTMCGSCGGRTLPLMEVQEGGGPRECRRCHMFVLKREAAMDIIRED